MGVDKKEREEGIQSRNMFIALGTGERREMERKQ
jgi:hypothetical protein